VKVPLLTRDPVVGETLPRICHMVIEWPEQNYTISSHKISL